MEKPKETLNNHIKMPDDANQHPDKNVCPECGADLSEYYAAHEASCSIAKNYEEKRRQERERKQHMIFATAEIISMGVEEKIYSLIRNSGLTHGSEADILSDKNLADKMSGAIKEILSEKLKDFDDEERYKIISKVDWPSVAQKIAVDAIYKSELIKTNEDVAEIELIEPIGFEEEVKEKPKQEVKEIKEEKITLSDDDKKVISGVVSQIESGISSLPDYKKEILVRKGIENIKVRFPANKESEVLSELSKAPLFAKEVFAKEEGKYKHFADQKKAKEYEMEIIDGILVNSMNFRIEQDTDEIIKGRKEITVSKDIAKIREIVKKIFEETLKGIDLFRTAEVFKKIEAKAEFPEAIKKIAKEELEKAMQKEFGNRKLIGGGAF